MGGLLLALTVTLVLALLSSACAREVAVKPPEASRDSSGVRGEAAQRALDRLRSALADGSRQDVIDQAAEPSRESLGWVYDNTAALRVTGLTMRYVDEATGPDEGQRARFGKDAWVGTVDVTYAYAGFDQDPARIETEVVFVPDGSGARIGAFGGADARTPLWLVNRLSVVRTARTLLLVSGDSAARYPALLSRAVRQVNRVLTDWTGPVVVEVPESRGQLDAVLQAAPGQYDNIAAVTTTADGSLAPGAPVRIFINPTVFDKLKDRGAQVVISHETTHVAVDAPFASMPTWLLEGFADYVALAHAGVPVSLAAGQILRRIRAKGLPDRLPTTADLDPAATGLGATYEEAWLACRFLASKYGEAKLVAFYGSVNGGASAAEAFRSALGTDQTAFVAAWRRDLARLAGVAG